MASVSMIMDQVCGLSARDIVSRPRGKVRDHILVMLLASIFSTAGDPEVQICC